jgi:hypothetical protein
MALNDTLKLVGVLCGLAAAFYPVDPNYLKNTAIVIILIEHKALLITVIGAILLSRWLLNGVLYVGKFFSHFIFHSVYAFARGNFRNGALGFTTMLLFVFSSSLLTVSVLQFGFLEIRSFYRGHDFVRQKLIERAAELEKEGYLSQAISIYQKIIAEFPDDERNDYIRAKIRGSRNIVATSKLLANQAVEVERGGENGLAIGLYSAAIRLWNENELAETKVVHFRNEFRKARSQILTYFEACTSGDRKTIAELFRTVGAYFFSTSDISDLVNRMQVKAADQQAFEVACEPNHVGLKSDELFKKLENRIFLEQEGAFDEETDEPSK